MTTLERIKYLESVTKREKALREEIDVQKSRLENLKFRLSHSESRVANRIYIGRIKHQKFVICALKHELEFVRSTKVKKLYRRDCNAIYECCSCHEKFEDWPRMPRNCPYCHRKIKE